MIDNQTKRVPPYDENAERAVVGSLMLENSVLDKITCELKPEDFYHTGNKLMFSAILELLNIGKVADLVTVCENLSTAGNLKKAGGNAYVSEVVDSVVSAFSINSYAIIVKEKSIERKIISEATRIIEAVYDPSGDSKAKLEEAQKTILNLSLAKQSDTLKNAQEICKSTFSGIEYRYNNRFSMIGHPTGIADLDSATSGLIGGDLIILAGRPGTGKSAVAGNIAATVAASGTAVLLFSLEMHADSVMTRIMARESGINSRNLRRGQLADNQWMQTVNATQSISRWPIYIDDKPDITSQEIRAKARKIKKEQGLGLLIVDYIQLVRSTGKHDSREQAVSEISRTLKAIARELDIPVIGLSQLNRQVDSRPDKHPMLSDLRESGAIEQDADIIIFIYRDELYNKSEDNQKRGIAEFDIAKHRSGETGRFEVIFDVKTQTIRNLVKQ
ncbi:MAG: replicative DNA helicase [Smithella sp.]|jgi:replicative DNA helicase